MTRARKNLSKSRRCTLCARPNVWPCTCGPLPLLGRAGTAWPLDTRSQQPLLARVDMTTHAPDKPKRRTSATSSDR
jgi:hypothetical protein